MGSRRLAHEMIDSEAPIQIDSRFKQTKALRAERRRRRLIHRIGWGVGAGLLTAIATVAVLQAPLWQGWLGLVPAEPELPQPGEIADEPVAVYIPAIVDLAGDPMRISLGDSVVNEVTRYVRRPEQIPVQRVAGDVAVLSDVMITTSQRFMTTLPSSPKDFALYQSQRAMPVAAYAPVVEESPEGVDPAAGGEAGAAGGQEQEAGPGSEGDVAGNTTSVAVVRPESRRFQPDGEYIGKVLVDRPLEDLMAEARFAPQDAVVFADALKRLLGRDGLVAGDIVAIHGVRQSAQSPYLRPVQMSLYNGGAYVGTISRGGPDGNEVVRGSDPWVYDNLFNYQGETEVAEPGRQYRLLDAIYSTAARNRVPTGILGEAIMLLSRSFDLNAFATTSDRLLLAYARSGQGEEGVGRILYVAVQGDDRSLQCYVFKTQPDGDYSCFTQSRGGQSVAMPPGMTTPVRGVLTVPFGPGMDPVLKKVVNHTGIEWSAPAGTPVLAAFAGTVSFAAQSGDDGNLVRISHNEGRETTYAHLQQFAPGIKPGSRVKAGDLIGYVGTTGVTAGPTLHFELHVNGRPVDPLATTTSVASDDDAVEQLTDRIIHVESGGNATAQNPLSSAFGAGQFIKSTWIRMMNTYRPDLARSMSEADLLALRADPTIAREMVQNLAREGEAYLRARGHTITAGRLYLCHFLGMQDAHVVLAADPTTPLNALVAPGVISANPFLVGMTAADVEAWAERKMSGKRSGPPPAPPVPPEFRIYQAAVDQLIQQATAPAGAPGAPTPEAPPSQPVAALTPDAPRLQRGGLAVA